MFRTWFSSCCCCWCCYDSSTTVNTTSTRPWRRQQQVPVLTSLLTSRSSRRLSATLAPVSRSARLLEEITRSRCLVSACHPNHRFQRFDHLACLVFLCVFEYIFVYTSICFYHILYMTRFYHLI